MDPVVSTPLVGQRIESIPPVEIDSAKEYHVPGCADSSMHRKQLHYLVYWTWYDVLTTEPAKFAEGLDQVGEVHESYSVKPGLSGKALRGSRQ